MNDLNKILQSRHHDPFQYLGAHFGTPDESKVTIRTFQPHASLVKLLIGAKFYPMNRIHEDGIFETILEIERLEDPLLNPYNYQYDIRYQNGHDWRTNDPYRFQVLLGEKDRFLFNNGTNYKIYNHLGAHLTRAENIKGTVFRVWAPNAKAVSVIGNFNSWDKRVHQMRSLGASGIWELFIPHLSENEIYKFSITTQENFTFDKADPYQFYGELRPKTGSCVRHLDSFRWTDHKWLEKQRINTPYNKPMSIYEVHPGSWQRDPAEPDRFLTYLELADKLIPYVKDMGFTHIELLPVMEHPLDESWGYQVTAPYSLTSRYGTPEEFMTFVDTCHNNDIGVILDWVPAHFPKDSHSLGKYDGSSLYEHEDHRLGSHPEWGTFIYNYGRNEVSNYLIANALFWLDKYHIDGLRVDAVASMLYLDYSRNEGEWLPNAYGGRENLEAIEFIRHLNSIIYDFYPNCLMIAEESTSFYGVSHPADLGGLGFGFKWNMGWMNDTLRYFNKDPFYRKYHHNNLTFSMMYAFSENFILPLSHDEVVHGKRSLLDKMPGDLWQKFANMRLLLLFMWAHPGKKLLFMGAEIGQWSEWYCKQSLDWHLLDEPLHAQLQNFMRDLNKFYTHHPPLWEKDFDPDGFHWLDLHDRDNSTISFTRYGHSKKNHLVCLFNFTPQLLTQYKLALPTGSRYKIVFCSDMEEYGGGGYEAPGKTVDYYDEPYALAAYHTVVTVPPLAGIILKPIDV